MVNKGKGMKKKGKPNARVAGKPKYQMKPKKKAKVPKEGVYFHCQQPGHWLSNCKLYLEGKKKKSSQTTVSASGIYVIELNLSTSNSWVLDTGSGCHICINV